MQNSERLALIFEGNANRLRATKEPGAIQLAASLAERARQVRRGQEELDQARLLLNDFEQTSDGRGH